MKKLFIKLLATLGYIPKWAVQKKNGHAVKTELVPVSSGNGETKMARFDGFHLQETVDRYARQKRELEMGPICYRVAARLQMRSLRKDSRLETMLGPGGFMAEQASLASERAVEALRQELQRQEMQQIALGSQVVHRQLSSEDSTAERTERRVVLCQGRFFLAQLLHAAEQGGDAVLSGYNLPKVQWITDSPDQFNERELTAVSKARKAAEKAEVGR